MLPNQACLEKHIPDADVSFVQLPLPIYERELTLQERNMHSAYWDKLTRLVPNKHFSTNRPIFNFMEIGLGLPTLSAQVRKAGYRMGLIDLFPFSGSDINYEGIRTVFNEAGHCPIYLLSPMTCGYDIFKKIAEIIKATYPESLVVAGGAHVSKLPEDTMKDITAVDVAATDSKFTIEDLLHGVIDERNLSQVSGIVFREGENLVRTNPRLVKGTSGRSRTVRDDGRIDLEILPSRYADSSWARIYSSLGCAYSCAYCADVLHIGRSPTNHDLEEVMRNVDIIRERFNVNLFYIGDETFTYDPQHAQAFARMMGERHGVYWIAQTRVDSVDRETLTVMRDNGCILLKFGAENASDSILKKMKKGTTHKQILAATALAKKVSLDTFTYWMTGLPGETERTVEESMGLQEELFTSGLCDLAEDVIFVPYPGTDIYLNPSRYGITIERKPWPQWREDMQSVTSTVELSNRHIYELWLKKINVLGDLIRNG